MFSDSIRMRRGNSHKDHFSKTRGSPEAIRSNRPNSRNRTMRKDRRSHSPVGRKMSPKRAGHHLSRKSRSPSRMGGRGRGGGMGQRRQQASPIRRPSLSPRRNHSPNLKRRSPELHSKRASAIGSKRVPPGRQQSSPLKSSVRRSFSPRRNDSRIHSNARSQSSRGQAFQNTSRHRSLSRSPPTVKKRRQSPISESHQNEGRRKGTGSDDASHFKDGRITAKSHQSVHRSDNTVAHGRSHEYPVQRQMSSFSAGDIDERFERRSLSPHFKKDDRYPDGTYMEASRGFQNDPMHREQQQQQKVEESRNFTQGAANSRTMCDDSGGRDAISNAASSVMPGTGKIYTQEELKTITVDIFRSMPQENIAAKHSNFNPNDVVVVRRTGEGVRPIFDRDEIRLAHVERGDAAFVERRVVALVKERSRSHSPRINSNIPPEFQGLEERENFQISSNNFNSYGPSEQLGSTRPSLNDRWQKLDSRISDREAIPGTNNRKTMLPRDMASGDYPDLDSRNNFGYGRSRDQSRTVSPDMPRPYPENRFSGRIPEYSDEWAARRGPREPEVCDRPYDQEASRRRLLPVNPHDLRHSLATKRRQSLDPIPRTARYSPENRERGIGPYGDRDFRDRSPRSRDGGMDRRAPDTTSDTRNRDLDRGRSGNESNWNRQDERDGRDTFNQGRLPNFSCRPDKYRYQEWLDKPDAVPKGPSYFEHDNRGDSYSRDLNSRGMGVRGRGRGFPAPRGGRGNVRVRGSTSFPYNTKSPFNRSGNKWSPNQWKHDRFETSPDRMSEPDDKPSSTTNK